MLGMSVGLVVCCVYHSVTPVEELRDVTPNVLFKHKLAARMNDLIIAEIKHVVVCKYYVSLFADDHVVYLLLCK